MYSGMDFIRISKTRSDVSLREILREKMQVNGISENALADALGLDRRALNKFINEGSDLKFSQAVLLMRFLHMDEGDFISAYEVSMPSAVDDEMETAETLSYIMEKFEIPALKRIGIIGKRTPLDTYEEQIMSFFGFNQSIHEYDTFIRHPALFSRSRRPIEQVKAQKMQEFWLKCAIYSFERINNPYDYDRDTLEQFMKKIHEYTEDVKHGYEKVVMVLFRLGITVLTQPYLEKTGAFGVTMIVDGKPCIVITDMQKNYHKLWISLIHELYHVLNDYDLLVSASFHITSENEPDLLFNEQKANSFALRVLVPQDVISHLETVVLFDSRMEQIAKRLAVDVSILYGVYLESLPVEKQSAGYMKYSKFLRKTSEVSRSVFFNPFEKQNLQESIKEIKEALYNIKIA